MSAGEAVTAAAWLTGAAVYWWAARQERRDTEGTGWLMLAGLAGGVLGAKLVQAVVSGAPLGALGGRTVLGGLAGGWLAVELAKRVLGMPRSTGDLWALALPAGEAVGRVGCLLNGCCSGAATSLPWAVDGRHPAQLYAAAGCAAIFLLLLRVRLPREGDRFRLFLALYCTLRFALEFVRGPAPMAGPLTLAQWACLAGLALAWRRRGGS